jgi:hypothetical protein
MLALMGLRWTPASLPSPSVSLDSAPPAATSSAPTNHEKVSKLQLHMTKYILDYLSLISCKLSKLHICKCHFCTVILPGMLFSSNRKYFTTEKYISFSQALQNLCTQHHLRISEPIKMLVLALFGLFGQCISSGTSHRFYNDKLLQRKAIGEMCTHGSGFSTIAHNTITQIEYYTWPLSFLTAKMQSQGHTFIRQI